MERREYILGLVSVGAVSSYLVGLDTGISRRLLGDEGESVRATTLSSEARGREISVNRESNQTTFTTYSFDEATLSVDWERIAVAIAQDDGFDSYALEVHRTPYPYGDITADDYIGFGSVEIDVDEIEEKREEVTIELTHDRFVGDQEYMLVALLRSTSGTSSEVAYLHETDPHVITSSGISRKSAKHSRPNIDFERYERRRVEGEYHVKFHNEAGGQNVAVVIRQSYYDRLKRRFRSQGSEPVAFRTRYVTDALRTGVADVLASELFISALRQNTWRERELVDTIVEYVQSLPYLDDTSSTGFNDYSRWVEETIVDGGGDCVDSSIMLASILKSEFIDLDVVFLQPPNHLAVGVHLEEEVPGGEFAMHEGKRYYYVETTAGGWSVGELPEIYQGEPIRVVPFE